MKQGLYFEKSWYDGPWQNDMVVVPHYILKKTEKSFVVGIVQNVKDQQCSLKLTEKVDDGHEQNKIFTIDKKDVLACFHPAPKSFSGLSARDILRALWGNLVFGRVTRVVTRAQDCNIWMNVPDKGEDGQISIQRLYLGDNKNKLTKLTKEEISNYITFEYDHYYGFCGFLTRKQQRSKTLPVDEKLKKPSDREIEEDLEELHIYDHDNELEEKDDHVNPELRDEELKKAKMYVDIDYRVDEELEKDHEFGESSFHFASNNFREPRLFTLLRKGMLDGWEKEDFFEEINYEKVTMTTPKLNDYIAGFPVKTKRGVTVTNWFVAPYAFFEIWKLVMSNTTFPKNYNYSSHTHTLKHRVNGNPCYFFLDLAKNVLFNTKTNNKNVDDFLFQLLKLI